MPIVTIALWCENSGTNRLNTAARKITAMQSGYSAFLKKVMFGSSHSKVSLPTPPLERAANFARLVSTFTDSTAVNQSGQPNLCALAKLRPNPSLNRTFCGSPGLVFISFSPKPGLPQNAG